MATGSDVIAGYMLVLLGVTVFTYYTLWVVILPFVDSGHLIHSFFPPPLYAVAVPIVAGVCVLIALGLYITVTVFRKKLKSKTS